MPIVGVDAVIFKHGDYPACDAIKSTMVYLTTQKCPLLYSSKLYVLDSCCPAVEAAFRQCTQKPVHVWCIQGCEKTQDGAVYERLIEDICAENNSLDFIVDTLVSVYSSWIDGAISNYNTDFFYQSREYIFESWKEGAPVE